MDKPPLLFIQSAESIATERTPSGDTRLWDPAMPSEKLLLPGLPPAELLNALSRDRFTLLQRLLMDRTFSIAEVATTNPAILLDGGYRGMNLYYYGSLSRVSWAELDASVCSITSLLPPKLAIPQPGDGIQQTGRVLLTAADMVMRFLHAFVLRTRSDSPPPGLDGFFERTEWGLYNYRPPIDLEGEVHPASRKIHVISGILWLWATSELRSIQQKRGNEARDRCRSAANRIIEWTCHPAYGKILIKSLSAPEGNHHCFKGMIHPGSFFRSVYGIGFMAHPQIPGGPLEDFLRECREKYRAEHGFQSTEAPPDNAPFL